MARNRLSAWGAGLSGGLLSLCGAFAIADDTEGLVRITDSCTRADQIQDGTAGAPCQTECGRGRGCRNGGGSGHIRGIASLINPCGAGTHSPDHGWAPPGRVPLPYPKPVAYQKWFPDPWTGQPVAYTEGGPRPPVIYMPTDTTQLGYYYQTVPRWHAYGGKIPSAPNPNDWHQDLCRLQGSYGYRGNCPPGGVPSGSIGPDVQPTPAGVPQPTPTGPVTTPGLEKSAQTPSLVPVK